MLAVPSIRAAILGASQSQPPTSMPVDQMSVPMLRSYLMGLPLAR
jgi:hypothetical protein